MIYCPQVQNPGFIEFLSEFIVSDPEILYSQKSMYRTKYVYRWEILIFKRTIFLFNQVLTALSFSLAFCSQVRFGELTQYQMIGWQRNRANQPISASALSWKSPIILTEWPTVKLASLKSVSGGKIAIVFGKLRKMKIAKGRIVRTGALKILSSPKLPSLMESCLPKCNCCAFVTSDFFLTEN